MRETASQALGAALRALRTTRLAAIVPHLQALAAWPEWEVRHGALLALKYLLAARTDAAGTLLPAALPSAIRGLQVGFSRSSLRVWVCVPVVTKGGGGGHCYVEVLSGE